jgi:hypothetical protein
MLRGGHTRAERWRHATNCRQAVGVAEINFKIKNLPAKPVDNRFEAMDSKACSTFPVMAGSSFVRMFDE